MLSHHRIRKVYRKELVDILRDRRTVLAMVVVPIVLYPLLMLGSAQALSSSVAEMGRRPVTVGVANPEDLVRLRAWIEQDPQFIEVHPTAGGSVPAAEPSPPADGGRPGGPESQPQPIALVGLYETQSPDRTGDLDTGALEQAVRDRRVHVCVVTADVQNPATVTETRRFRLICDPGEVRSGFAASQVRLLLDRAASREVERRAKRFGFPLEGLHPVGVEETTVTTPGSVLGQILPVILVLMTITGAIYPAIDLTAGERERGTLETLMVCPVPVFELIMGKFLVVTTVAIAGAALNLASISATVYFGGFHSALGIKAQTGGFPFGILPIILVLLIPFAVFFSGIMIAVSSCARTFKEAQNYVTPVVLAALIPSGLAALPTSELRGGLLVMPVANMVLLTRELLLGSPVSWTTIAWVMVSTTLYAVSSVAIAARIYGSESVVFADSGSLRAVFARRMFRPSPLPSAAMVMLTVTLLFPVWFFIQIRLQPRGMESIPGTLRASAAALPVFFILLPVLLLAYGKVGIRQTLCLQRPRTEHVVAGVLIGLAAWVPAAELSTLQAKLIGAPQALEELNEAMAGALRTMRPAEVILCLGIVPGLCEEIVFRGFLLSGLRTVFRKWTAIILAACVFAVFHFFFFKVPVTAALGVLLGYLCWQSASIWPSVIAHVLHNSVTVAVATLPWLATRLGIGTASASGHLPAAVILIGTAVVLVGLVLVHREGARVRGVGGT